MILLFLISGTAAGGIVGLIFGLVAAVALPVLPIGFGTSTTLAAFALVAIGSGLDLVAMATGRLRPPAVGRQVPQEWGRLLPSSATAVLYGARLGVGPLTILSTWSWWSATFIGAASGIVAAVIVGSAFGLVRLATTVAVSLLSTGPDQARTFLRLRRKQRPVWLTVNGLGLVGLLAITVAGCSSSTPAAEARGPLFHRPVAVGSPTPTVTPTTVTTATTVELGAVAGVVGSSSVSHQSLREPIESVTLVTAPAQLEDFVRPVQLDAPPVETTVDLLSTPESLSAALVSTIAGFELVEDDGTDRFLDIVDASELQPDPTEELTLLETRGFEGGWTRAFRSVANDVAVMSVYHFEDAAEAEFYLEDGLITIGGYGGKFFDIEGLPGVRGFSQSTIDDGEPLMILGAAFQAGPRWHLVYLVGAPERVGPDVLIPMILSLQETSSARSAASVVAE